MKRKNKIGTYIIRSLVSVICCLIIYISFKIIYNPFIFRSGIRLENKDAMFQFVLDNREKLEEIVLEMEELYDAKNEYSILIDMFSYGKYKLKAADELIEKYKISFISVKMENESYEVTFSFDSAPKGYTYWGVYYAENGKPSTWGEGKLVESDSLYIQKGSYYIYETEQIIDNWYYFQCDAR